MDYLSTRFRTHKGPHNDIIAVIQSWMGTLPSQNNIHAIFAEIDTCMNLASGSIATKWGHVVKRKGDEIILFHNNTGGLDAALAFSP